MEENKKYILKLDNGKFAPYVYHVWHDGYRLYCEQVSELPLNGKGRGQECVFEWKHSYALCAYRIVEALLSLASGKIEIAEIAEIAESS